MRSEFWILSIAFLHHLLLPRGVICCVVATIRGVCGWSGCDIWLSFPAEWRQEDVEKLWENAGIPCFSAGLVAEVPAEM